MHSSRMHTGQMLTVFQCLVPGGWGGGVSPKKAEIKKNSPPKKLGDPPSTPLNPPNHTPPKKLETP